MRKIFEAMGFEVKMDSNGIKVATYGIGSVANHRVLKVTLRTAKQDGEEYYPCHLMELSESGNYFADFSRDTRFYLTLEGVADLVNKKLRMK